MSLLNSIICDDVLSGLAKIPDNSVHLVFSSPPYNIEIKYKNRKDNQPYSQYVIWLKEVIKECNRVLVNGGRLAINIDSVRNRQDDEEYMRPIYADLVNIGRDIGLKFRTEICWYKQNWSGRATAFGCYDSETRVLTKNGLKYFKNIDINKDVFATLNIESGQVEYHKAINNFSYHYAGDMNKFKSKDFDLLVTPNHKMLLWNKFKRNLYFSQANDCPASMMIPQRTKGWHNGIDIENFFLPVCDYGKRTNPNYISNEVLSIKMDDWLMFLGIFLTDGSVYFSEKNSSYKIAIYQSKKQNIDKIQQLLDRLPFKFIRKEKSIEWYTCNKRLAFYLHKLNNKNKRQLPDFILDLSSRQKKIFFDWLVIGDGCINKNKISLAIASDEFVSKLSKILVDLNMTFSVSKQISKSHYLKSKLVKSNYPINIINIKKSNFYHIRESNGNKKQEYYDGMVYCVEVPNHTLFVERKGKTTWCGNSFNSCSNPTIRRNHEYVLVWSKGDWKLEGDSELSDMTAKEFQEWTFSTWFIQPETKNRNNHPAPFPEELAKRVIKLFSYRGNTVLDIFMGTGTTGAVAKIFGRNYIGIDNSKDDVEYARARIDSIDNLFDSYVPRSKRMEIEKSNKKDEETTMNEVFDGI